MGGGSAITMVLPPINLRARGGQALRPKKESHGMMVE
jgi:hypothetical protein